MTHQFFRIDEQVKAGLHVTRRLASYLTKVATLQAAYCADVLKVNAVERDKTQALIQEDFMKQHVLCAAKVQDLVSVSHRIASGTSLTSQPVRLIRLAVHDRCTRWWIESACSATK